MINLNKIINKIKINVITKKKNLIINKINLKHINFLIKLNIIKYVIKNGKKFILIIKFFKLNKTLFNLKNLNKPSHSKYIKLHNLKKINSKNRILIISSNKGIINNFEAEQKKTGGVILFYIWN